MEKRFNAVCSEYGCCHEELSSINLLALLFVYACTSLVIICLYVCFYLSPCIVLRRLRTLLLTSGRLIYSIYANRIWWTTHLAEQRVETRFCDRRNSVWSTLTFICIPFWCMLKCCCHRICTLMFSVSMSIIKTMLPIFFFIFFAGQKLVFMRRFVLGHSVRCWSD